MKEDAANSNSAPVFISAERMEQNFSTVSREMTVRNTMRSRLSDGSGKARHPSGRSLSCRWAHGRPWNWKVFRTPPMISCISGLFLIANLCFCLCFSLNIWLIFQISNQCHIFYRIQNAVRQNGHFKHPMRFCKLQSWWKIRPTLKYSGAFA